MQMASLSPKTLQHRQSLQFIIALPLSNYSYQQKPDSTEVAGSY